MARWISPSTSCGVPQSSRRETSVWKLQTASSAGGGVADQVQHLHGTGHGHVEQPRAERGAIEYLVCIDYDHTVELQTLHRFRREHRYIGVGELMDVIHHPQTVSSQ